MPTSPGPPTRFRLGLVQMRCTPDPDANLAAAVAHVREAAAAGAAVVCLPELFRHAYFCQREDPAFFDLAEPVPGPTTDALARVARETGAVVVGSVFERRAAGVYTTPPWSSTPTGASPAATARCTSPTIRST